MLTKSGKTELEIAIAFGSVVVIGELSEHMNFKGLV